MLEKTLCEYISLVNDIVDYAIAVGRMPKLSSASVHAPLPSALRDQCRLDVRSIYKKSFKVGKCPILHKPVAFWNNQNYKFGDGCVKLPVWLSGKCKQVSITARITEVQLKLLKSSELGSLRVLKRNGKWIAQVAYKRAEVPREGVGVMGIDATLAGIQLEYVDPKYTSQRCPECGKRNHAKDRAYRCSCGYHGHRDLVGARNILVSPAVDGHSLPA